MDPEVLEVLISLGGGLSRIIELEDRTEAHSKNIDLKSLGKGEKEALGSGTENLYFRGVNYHRINDSACSDSIYGARRIFVYKRESNEKK